MLVFSLKDAAQGGEAVERIKETFTVNLTAMCPKFEVVDREILQEPRLRLIERRQDSGSTDARCRRMKIATSSPKDNEGQKLWSETPHKLE